jgi:hypothetical protein
LPLVSQLNRFAPKKFRTDLAGLQYQSLSDFIAADQGDRIPAV